MTREGKMVAPSLVDLCVDVAIENVKYLGDVGETDLDLLGRILCHCTLDQLTHVENSTVGRDLSPVTDPLWRNFYELKFGERSTNIVLERMKQKNVSFLWKQLYEAKLENVSEAETKAVARLRQLYKDEDAKKQSRKIQICSLVPPSSNKRSWGGTGGYNLGHTRSNIMKKAKLDFLKSPELKNIAAMNRGVAQRRISSTSTSTTRAIMRPGSNFTGKNPSASSSARPASTQRRF